MGRLLSNGEMRCFSCRTYRGFSLKEATGYYLPEGRFYAAPLVLRQDRLGYQDRLWYQGLCRSVILIICWLWSMSSPLHEQEPGFFITTNSTVILPMPNGSMETLTSKIISNRAQKHGDFVLKGSFATEKINKKEKEKAIYQGRIKKRSLLLIEKPVRQVISLAERFVEKKDIGTIVSPEDSKIQFQIRSNLRSLFYKRERQLPVPSVLAALVNNDKPDIMALGYAPQDIERMRHSPFDTILTVEDKKNGGRFVPRIGDRDHAWVATALPASSFSSMQQKCLAEAIYFEARSESLHGQAAVAQIVLNRVRNPAYPETICQVVYQNIQFNHRCQFSFACDGQKHYVTEPRAWQIAKAIAKAVSAGQIWLADIGSSTHYHAIYVRPSWSSSMYKTQRIGQHIFYRTKGGGWS